MAQKCCHTFLSSNTWTSKVKYFFRFLIMTRKESLMHSVFFGSAGHVIHLQHWGLDVVICDSLDVAILHLLTPYLKRLATKAISNGQESALKGVRKHIYGAAEAILGTCVDGDRDIYLYIYSHENKENALNEKVCPNFWPVLYIYIYVNFQFYNNVLHWITMLKTNSSYNNWINNL